MTAPRRCQPYADPKKTCLSDKRFLCPACLAEVRALRRVYRAAEKWREIYPKEHGDEYLTPEARALVAALDAVKGKR